MTAPVADSFVRRIFQCHITGGDRDDCGAEHLHFLYIGVLAFHIGLAHIDDTFHIHQGADGSGGYPVLAGSCFSDDTCFTHAACQQDLSDRVVDLMCSCMVQVFPFQVDFASVLFA